MAIATRSGGQLNDVECYIEIPGMDNGKIQLRIVPEISDTKKATYADQTIIGRSTPIKTYSHSDNRVISMKMHFITIEEQDLTDNVNYLRALASATYPRTGDPYTPPPVCKIKCGDILADEPLCCILESYNVTFPTNVAWDKKRMIPYYFEVSTTWHVVYSSSSGLPNQERILGSGK